jgi:hypothetical protein
VSGFGLLLSRSRFSSGTAFSFVDFWDDSSEFKVSEFSEESGSAFSVSTEVLLLSLFVGGCVLSGGCAHSSSAIAS